MTFFINRLSVGIFVCLAILALFILIRLNIWFFIFNGHGVEDSRSLLLLFGLDEGCDIDDFSFVLVKPTRRDFKFLMGGSGFFVVGFHDSGDQIMRDLPGFLLEL